MAPLPTESAKPSVVGTKTALTCAAILVAPLLMAIIIHRYGINVPYWDEWDQLAIVTRAYDHTLSPAMLWEQQNEHRPVVSKLISIAIARTTNLNLVAEMYLGLGFQLISLVLVWRMLAAGLRDTAPSLIGPLTVSASLMLFWPVAHEDWIWGLASVQYFLSVLWAVVAVWALTRWPARWPGVLTSLLATTLAIFTTGCGFALVGVSILGILNYGIARKKVPWVQLLAFGFLSAVPVIMYLRDYTSPHYSPTSGARLDLMKMASYFITYVGSPFWIRTAGYRSCQVLGFAGIVGMAGALYYLLRCGRSWALASFPWMLLGCYTLINAAVTAFARIDFGVDQAASSRYRPIATLFWISLAALLSMVAYQLSTTHGRKHVMVLSTAAVILSLTGYWYLYYRGFGALTRHSEYVAAGIPYIINYEHAADDELRMYHPTPAVVRDLSRKLDQYHLGPFAESSRPGVVQ